MQGGEDVFMCLRSGGEVAIRRYFIALRHDTPMAQNDENFRDKQWELSDGRLSCRFSRAMKVDYDSVDLNNNWYQLYAWGAVSQCPYIVSFSLNGLLQLRFEHDSSTIRAWFGYEGYEMRTIRARFEHDTTSYEELCAFEQ